MHRTRQAVPKLGKWSLLLLMSLASVYGQSIQIMEVKIPFPFVVSNTSLPAGEYTIESLWHINGGLLIRSSDGRASKIFLARPDKAPSSLEESLLVFRHCGEQYFLSQVRNGTLQVRYELTPSRREREAAKKASPDQQSMMSLAAEKGRD